MELTTWSMYWLVKLDSIQMLAVIIGLFAIVFSIIALMNTWENKYRPVAIFATVCAVIIFLFGVFLPDTKQMAAIILIPKIVQNEQVQQVPDKLLQLGIEWMEELRPGKEQK